VQILQIFNYSYTISFTIVLCQTNTQNALTVIHMKQKADYQLPLVTLLS